MWEMLLLFAAFCGGIGIGKARATNADITNRTSYMQDLIDEAYEKRDAMKKQWLDAEEQTETWKRRYWALIEELENEEDGFGSGDDGSYEGSERPNQLQEN
jgi:hypothetical protein